MTDYDKLLKKVTDYLYEQNVRSDCGIESLAEDLMNIVLNRPAYDKMCFLLEDIDCHFTTRNCPKCGLFMSNTTEQDKETE